MYNTNAFSFAKIINGISKSLNIANQLIPLYQQSKPIINNAKNILNIFSTTSYNKNIINKKNTDNKTINQSNPVFFQ